MLHSPDDQLIHRVTMVNAPEATNTLIIVPRPTSSAALFAALRWQFEQRGTLRLWAPLHGLGRAIAIYASDEEAADAKSALDRSLIEERWNGGLADNRAELKPYEAICLGTVGPDPSVECSHRTYSILLRVYAGPRTPESLLSPPSAQHDAHLPVPVSDKNFLISPPGSPPVGWEQIREDPPNIDTLAEDLMRALHSLGGPGDAQGLRRDTHEASPFTPPDLSPRNTVLIAAAEDDSLPSVLVSDLDGRGPPTSSNGLSIAGAPHGIRRTPSPRPPGGGIHAVKATVDSLNGNGRITPTARPPVRGW